MGLGLQLYIERGTGNLFRCVCGGDQVLQKWVNVRVAGAHHAQLGQGQESITLVPDE